MRPAAASPPYLFIEGCLDSSVPAGARRTVSIVHQEGYVRAGRTALGDGVDLVVEAGGTEPRGRALERRHHYVRSNGTLVPNPRVRELIERGDLARLDDWIHVEEDGLALLMFAGELRAGLPDGAYEGGHALLLVSQYAPMRWFSLLDKSDGSKAWCGDDDVLRGRLARIVRKFVAVETCFATPMQARREELARLDVFCSPVSDPSSHKNVFDMAAAIISR